jgi:hypothetical protein
MSFTYEQFFGDSLKQAKIFTGDSDAGKSLHTWFQNKADSLAGYK